MKKALVVIAIILGVVLAACGGFLAWRHFSNANPDTAAVAQGDTEAPADTAPSADPANPETATDPAPPAEEAAPAESEESSDTEDESAADAPEDEAPADDVDPLAVTEEEAIRLMIKDLTIDETEDEMLDLVRQERKDPRRWDMSHIKYNYERLRLTGLSDAFSTSIAALDGIDDPTPTDLDKAQLEIMLETIHSGKMIWQFVLYYEKLEFLDKDGTKFSDINGLNKEYVEEVKRHGLNTLYTYHRIYWLEYGVEPPKDKSEWAAWSAETGYPIPTMEQMQLITDADGVNIPYMTDEALELANRILITFGKFKPIGVKSLRTNQFLIPPVGASENWAFPRWNTDPNYYDSSPALVFAYERKDGVYDALFGFNKADKRLEVFDLESKGVKTNTPVQPQPPTPPAPVPPTPPEDPNPPPAEDPTDPPAVNPGTPPSTPPSGPPSKPPSNPPELPKDPTKDPVNQGNADQGGGPNDPGNNEDRFHKDDPKGDTSQGHQDPGNTVPQEPKPAPGHEDATNDQNKMDYTPEDNIGGTSQSTTWSDSTTGQTVTEGGTTNDPSVAQGVTTPNPDFGGEMSAPLD